MKRRRWILLISLVVLAPTVLAQEILSSYSPTPLEPGTIRSWGDNAMRTTMLALEQGFRRYHPEITFQDTLLGSATGMAGIITGTSDLSVMGRPATPNEVMGFEWVFRTEPLGIQVMNGNLQDEGKSPALAIFVSRDNPVQELTLARLGTILGCPADAREPVTWRTAGVTGPWAARRIHAYLYDEQTGTGSFLQKAVLGDRDCWNWDVVREFKDEARPDGSLFPAAEQIAEALERDPDGLAITTLHYQSSSIKSVKLASSGSAVPLSRDAVIQGRYPLARGIYIYLNRPKDKPVDPKLREFLRYVLSREGQAVVEQAGDFLPLNRELAHEQERLLE